MRGVAHVDRWSANHKILTNFVYFAITQENQYLLGNGASFGNAETKSKLSGTDGRKYDFDSKLKEAGRMALIGGAAFVLYNKDHLEPFAITEFAPLYDEESGALMAGIRFWQSPDGATTRMTLFEIDGYTDFVKTNNANMKVLAEKRPYKITAIGDKKDIADGTVIYKGENYPTFPIIPLYGNDKHTSELVGRRGTLDAFDLLNSNLVNNVDEANLIYWTISNSGGMDDVDDAKFIERLKTIHVAHTDSDSQISAEKVEAPVNASAQAIDTIRARLYEDFMCLNVADVSAGNKTATEIIAAYQPLDSKTDEYEYCILDFLYKLLELAGIKDTVSFTRSKIVNKSDEMQTILSAAEYLDTDTVTELICGVLGIADKTDNIIKQRRAEEISRTVHTKTEEGGMSID